MPARRDASSTHLASVTAASTKNRSGTIEAPEAVTPRPTPGKMYMLFYGVSGRVTQNMLYIILYIYICIYI